MAEIKIRGLAELEQRLKAFPIKLQRRALGNAMAAGARAIRDEIKQRAPVATGALKRNVASKRGQRRFDKPGQAARQIVGVRHGRTRQQNTTVRLPGGKTRTFKRSGYDRRGEDPYYYRFQELGYRAVGRRKARSGAAKRAGRGVTGRYIAGRHFLRDGLAVAGPRALEAVRARLAREIERLA